MKRHSVAAVLAALAGFVAVPLAVAEDLPMKEVASLPPVTAGSPPARTILFTDHRNDELVDPVTGLIRFSDWERSRPQQKALLGLFPSYEEPTATGTDAAGKPRHRRIHVYVAEARFPIDKPPGAVDLTRMVSLGVL